MSNVARLTAVSAALQQVKTDAEQAADAVDQAADRIASRADDFRIQMEILGDAGNVLGEQMAGIIAQFEEGVLQDRLAVINSMGDGLTVVNGQLRSVRDVLSDVLPSAGEVQARIREMVAELKADGVTLEELASRLSEQHNIYAKQLAEWVRLMKAGRITMEEVVRRAQELSEQFPGSEGAALADLLLEGIRDGSLT